MSILKEGSDVILEWDGKNIVGKIERIIPATKKIGKRYHVRAESGRLYPAVGLTSSIPGKVNVPLSKAYFAAKEVEAEIAEDESIDEAVDRAIEMENEEDTFFGNVDEIIGE